MVHKFAVNSAKSNWATISSHFTEAYFIGIKIDFESVVTSNVKLVTV